MEKRQAGRRSHLPITSKVEAEGTDPLSLESKGEARHGNTILQWDEDENELENAQQTEEGH